MNIFDAATTACSYGDNRQPTQAAHRGAYQLAHMSQQLGRDFAGETYISISGPYAVIFTTAEWRERVHCPYLYLVKCPLFLSHTAFMTAESLLDWCSAYAVTLRPRLDRFIVEFSAEIGDPADWLPLELRELAQ